MYTDEKRTYRRVVGGIAWPGDFPGFAVVIGEESYPAVGSKDYHLYVLAEAEEMDVHQLFRRCADLSVKYSVKYDVFPFYGRRDQAMMSLLNLWHRDARDNRRDVFDFDSALNSDNGNISYHINVVKELLLPERKILHLSDVIEKPKLPAHIQSLPPNVGSIPTDIEYPAVAALGYAVTFLKSFRYDDYEEDEEERSTDTVDPITGY